MKGRFRSQRVGVSSPANAKQNTLWLIGIPHDRQLRSTRRYPPPHPPFLSERSARQMCHFPSCVLEMWLGSRLVSSSGSICSLTFFLFFFHVIAAWHACSSWNCNKSADSVTVSTPPLRDCDFGGSRSGRVEASWLGISRKSTGMIGKILELRLDCLFLWGRPFSTKVFFSELVCCSVLIFSSSTYLQWESH